MKVFTVWVGRNMRLFFKDKGMFFTALITPLILLVLYTTFLGGIYRDTFEAALAPAGLPVSEDLLNGAVGGQLTSSLLAVCCVTVAFCSNMLSVQDKANGTLRDLTVSPMRPGLMALGYYVATLLTTLLICLCAAGACLIYMRATGWYLSGADVWLILADVCLLTVFGTALSGLINFFLSSQGQISAVGTIVSAGYGFICGAYMPISSFSEGLQRVISFLPGTYGTSLLRNHALGGVFRELTALGFPQEAVDGLRDAMDCQLYFFDTAVPIWGMYAVLGGFAAVVLAAYVLLMRFGRARV